MGLTWNKTLYYEEEKEMKRKLFVAAVAAMALMAFPSHAGEWKQDTVGYWYQNDDGSYIVSDWLQDTDGKWYYFNKDGYMVTGWLHFTDTDEYYYFNADGSMRTEPLVENGVTYTFDESGVWNNNADSQIQQIYDDEALRLWIRDSQIGNMSGNHSVPGVDLSDENIVYYHNVAND